MTRPDPNSAYAWEERLSTAHRKAIRLVEEAGGDFQKWIAFLNGAQAHLLGKLVMGKLKLEGTPSEKNVPHLIPDWLTVVPGEDVEPTIKEGMSLSFPGFFKDGETYIDGPTMRIRAKDMKSDKSLSDVPALLGEDGKGLKTIPSELRGKVYIVLTGTLLRRSDGNLCVPYLFWLSDEWDLGFGRLGRDWLDDGRLVSCE